MRLFIAATALLIATTANAQQLTRQQLMEVRAACQADLKQFCAGIQPGGGKLAQCLQQNAANISQPCQAKLLELKAARPSN